MISHPCKTPWQQKWIRLDCYRTEIQALADTAEKFCGRWYRNNPVKSLLVLLGESNCGKTHVAAAIHRFALSAAFKAFEDGHGTTWTKSVPSVSFIRWPELIDEFKEGNYGAMQDMMEVDLLILDDVGAEHDPSKSGTSKLCQILSRRESKFTVITSNVPPEQWPQRFDTRIADRMLRNSEVVSLFGLGSYAVAGE